MRQILEIEGKSVKSAIEEALKTLGARRSDVEIEILREEKRGLFGMKGQLPAKVRVVLKSDAERQIHSSKDG